MKYRTLFISDIHLGTIGCQTKPLIDFLKKNEFDIIYLVGDIIDFWAMKGRIRWQDECSEVIRIIMKMAHKGVRVYYIPGNHDEIIRKFVGDEFGNIMVLQNAIHVTATGDRYFVTHGDEADAIVRVYPVIAKLGSIGYNILMWLNHHVNRLRTMLGLPRWSFSEYIKKRVKDAVKFVGRFEEVLTESAKHYNVKGVIAGHIHTPANKMVNELEYYNCGDWIGNLTVIVEHTTGTLELVYYDKETHINSNRRMEATN
jgi:UDP-2,3-diacylglucosamine pyrophosphatase LpxH